ncbi:unnamed protein product [Brassica napus]|uniref:(rape) hypothetical protein n=1 Tax=Brassica napus TaxID=3708 RepID=A0A816IVX8_BRANA|nr:unnamed protein product [Brassica napus]
MKIYCLMAWQMFMIIVLVNSQNRIGNTVPSFDLYLSPNLWTMVQANSTTIKEVIHDTTSQSSLQICLVNTATCVPFINVLELRPLNRDAYTTPSGSIKMLFRSYHGNPESAMIR